MRNILPKGAKITSCLLLCVLLTACKGLTLSFHDGGEKPWEDFRGSWVFINYWAEWCGPCREEMPELNDFARAFPDQVELMGVNYDLPEAAELKRQIAALGVKFPVLLKDPANHLNYSAPAVLPATMVFNPKGEFQGVMLGPQTRESLELWLEKTQVSSVAMIR